MRVEPEEVLEEHRIAAQGWIENPDFRDAFHDQKNQSDRENWGRENLNDRSCVERPDEERQARPGQARCAQLVNRHDEVQTRENGRKARDESAEDHENDRRARTNRVRSVERPAGIRAAEKQSAECDDRTGDEDIVGRQVDSRKGDVFCAEHDRKHEVSESARNPWNDDQKHHDRAVVREHLIVSVRVHQSLSAGKMLQANQHGENSAQQEEEQNREQVHDPDPLVIESGHPRPDTFAMIQVVMLWELTWLSLSSVCH